MTKGEGRIEVILPRALLEYSQGHDTVQLSGTTLAEILGQLNVKFPGLRERIVDDQGQIRQYVHVFVNGDSVPRQEPEAVALRPGDEVQILPSVAGG